MDENEITELTEEDIFFNRDEKGELIPKEVVSEKLGKKIKILPFTRGEWIKFRNEVVGDKSTEDQDAKAIEKFMVSPKVSAEDLTKYGRVGVTDEIMNLILKYSDLTVKKKIIPKILKKDVGTIGKEQ